MVLPLYLAMTAQEMASAPALPRYPGCFCHNGTDLPGALPPGAMLLLTDRCPWAEPDPRSAAARIADAVRTLECGSVLLDFERNPTAFAVDLVKALSDALPCPLAAPPGFSGDADCAVFPPPCPLHVPLTEYLRPWKGRAVWLDVTLQRQTITVTPSGTRYGIPAPADRQDGGWFDDTLLCRAMTEISDEHVDFLLFDTPDTLNIKLEQAAALGVTRAVGLYQELYGKL